MALQATTAPADLDRVLTPAARAFIEDLTRRFRPALKELLAARAVRQARLDAGTERLDFLAETAGVRSATGRWRRSRATCWTGGWRSPGRSTGR